MSAVPAPTETALRFFRVNVEVTTYGEVEIEAETPEAAMAMFDDDHWSYDIDEIDFVCQAVSVEPDSDDTEDSL